MIVSQLDPEGYFVCAVEADESPLEPGVFLIPGGAISAAPPSPPDGKRARWLGGSWAFESLPAQAAPEPIEQGEAPTTPAAPISVSPLQAFTALDNAGLLQQVFDHMTAPTTPLLVRLAFGSATEWRRDSLLVMNAAIALNMPPEQVDQLFIDAGKVIV